MLIMHTTFLGLYYPKKADHNHTPLVAHELLQLLFHRKRAHKKRAVRYEIYILPMLSRLLGRFPRNRVRFSVQNGSNFLCPSLDQFSAVSPYKKSPPSAAYDNSQSKWTFLGLQMLSLRGTSNFHLHNIYFYTILFDITRCKGFRISLILSILVHSGRRMVFL